MASITKKPTLAVSKLCSPVRQSGNRVMKSTWTVPADLTKTSKKNRAEGLVIEWRLDIPGKNDPKYVKVDKNLRTNNSQINLNNLTIGKTTYTRNSFYPLHKSRKLYSVTCKVTPKNRKGLGKAASQTRKFETPRAPSISAFSFNTENGEVSATITTDAGNDYKERYDTRYTVYIENTRTGQKYNYRDTSSTSTSIAVTFDASDYQQLEYSQYIKIKITAWSRGFAGDSAKVSKEYYVSYPAQATVQDVNVSAKDSTGKATVAVNTNSTTEHPVDRVKLEYLANTNYEREADIPGDASPTETSIIDDAQCTALAMPVGPLIPDKGKYTWIRVKSWHLSEEVLYRYSAWMRVTALETPAPTAADDEIVILEANAGVDGQSAVLLLGWNADGTDDSTGTEITWADEEDVWKSTQEPSKFEFEWSDGELEYDEVTYHDSATLTIKNLEEATQYFIKARRYLTGEITTYTPYSDTATVLTSEKPEKVIASCDRYVPTGKALSIYWTFSGNGVQKEWQIVSTDGTVLAKGEGGISSTQISAERLKEFAVNGSISFTVQTSTGSGFVISEEHTITIIDNPEIALTVTTPVTVQPVSFAVTANALCDLIVIVSAQGASGQFPQGIARQTPGDTIHSDIYVPEWTAGQDNYTTTITLPAGLNFWDGGSYMLSITAIDRTTGLRSIEVISPFTVAWAHQAVDPGEYVTVTPIDTYDEEGFHRIAAMIELTPPAESEATDVYDIYRLTGDGAQLIGEGFPLTYTAYDEYAPFGINVDLAYRVAIRTLDGDVEFTDIEYVFEQKTLRFDWMGGFLELPYNISIGDTYKKDVEIRQHMDGSVDGYWNQNIVRTAKLSTDVIKLDQKLEIDMARALARYAGAVFVRTPEGTAYEADVQVSDMSANNKHLMAIAIDVQETGLTKEFALPTPFDLEEEEE